MRRCYDTMLTMRDAPVTTPAHCRRHTSDVNIDDVSAALSRHSAIHTTTRCRNIVCYVPGVNIDYHHCCWCQTHATAIVELALALAADGVQDGYGRDIALHEQKMIRVL